MVLSQVQVDSFLVKVAVNLLGPCLPAVSAHLVAPEAYLQIEQALAVDPDRAVPDARGDIMSGGDILCPHTARQTIVSIVSDQQSILQRVEGHDRRDRAKNLLTGNRHVVAHTGEDGGFDEEAGRQMAPRR